MSWLSPNSKLLSLLSHLNPTALSLPSKVTSFSVVKLLVTVKLELMVWDPVSASVDPLNVKLPLSSNSPLAPAMTTLLSVKSPILAVSASNVSIFAVPSMNRLFHSEVAAPIL